MEFRSQGTGAERPKYILANGDESEPWHLQDRPRCFEMDPHQLIEGMVIAGTARQRARRGFILHPRRIPLTVLDNYGRAAVSEAYAKGLPRQDILGAAALIFDLNHPHRRRRLRMRRRIGARWNRSKAKGAATRASGRPFLPSWACMAARAVIIQCRDPAAPFPPIINKGGEWYAEPRHSQKWRHAPLFPLSQADVNPPGNLYELPLGFPACVRLS